MFDYGKYTPYVLTSYGIAAVVIIGAPRLVGPARVQRAEEAGRGRAGGRAMKRWWAILPLAVFVGLVVVAFVQLSRPAPAPASFISPQRPAPQFDVAGLDGGQVKLSDFAGRPVLVNFWATWCAPCKLEHPLLVEMREQGVEIVGVLYKDPNGLDGARQILAQDGNPFAAVGLDPHGRSRHRHRACRACRKAS